MRTKTKRPPQLHKDRGKRVAQMLLEKITPEAVEPPTVLEGPGPPRSSSEPPVEAGKPTGGEPAPSATASRPAKRPAKSGHGGARTGAGRPFIPDKVPQHVRQTAAVIARSLNTTEAVLDALAITARYLLRGEMPPTIANALNNILATALRAIDSAGTTGVRGTLIVKLKAKGSSIGGRSHAAPPKPQTPDQALAQRSPHARRLVTEPSAVATTPEPEGIITERTTTLKLENLSPEQMAAALATHAPDVPAETETAEPLVTIDSTEPPAGAATEPPPVTEPPDAEPAATDPDSAQKKEGTK